MESLVSDRRYPFAVLVEYETSRCRRDGHWFIGIVQHLPTKTYRGECSRCDFRFELSDIDILRASDQHAAFRAQQWQPSDPWAEAVLS